MTRSVDVPRGGISAVGERYAADAGQADRGVKPGVGRDRIAYRRNVFQGIAFVFCVVFGLALIADTQPACDGVWFWYSFFLRGGKHLYSDMHLVQQPLYVLETSAFMAVLGKGWLVSKIPAVLHLVAYCVGLFLLVRQSSLSDARKAILFTCSFFVSISFGVIVFSDYHVLTDCFVLYSLVALLSLRTSSSVRRTLGLAAVLGVLSALAVTTRLNDGAALFVGVFLAIVCLAPAKKLLSLLLFCLTTGLTVVLIVLLTGDSLHDYARYSIFRAAGVKGGGGGSVLAQPLRLPWNTVEWLMHIANWACIHAFVAALILVVLLRPLSRRRGRWQLGLAVVAVVVVAFYARQICIFRDTGLLVSVAAVLVLLAYGLGVWVAARFLFWLFDPRRANGWDRREILLLIPLGLMASGAMSSAGTHWSTIFEPAGIFIVLLAIYSPIRLKRQWLRDVLVVLCVLLTFCTVTNKFREPFHWLTYKEKPLFAGRTWYRHPDYGPMIIDRDLLQMIQPVCQTIRDGGSDGELLSLPFPGGNFFCSIPPWHGYVQTFFDTTCKQTIENLMDELQSSPPKWIFYQRQLRTLRLHEVTYNQGNPLQQRYLDQLIEQKIHDKTWRVVYTSDYGTSRQWGELWDNEWILIQTR